MKRILSIVVLCLAATMAHATTGLALTCGTGTAVPKACVAGWTWQKPAATSIVKTSGGSWRIFANELKNTEAIELCSVDVAVGTTESTCKKTVNLAACNAAGQTCTVTPPPPAPTVYAATIDIKNPTTYVDGTALTIASENLYRGVKADGSDLKLITNFKPATSYTDSGLAAGMWCYGVTALDSAKLESVLSNALCLNTNTPSIVTLINLTIKPQGN